MSRLTFQFFVLGIAATLLAVSSLQAQTAYEFVPTSGGPYTWNLPANWITTTGPGTTFPDGAADTGIFGLTPTEDVTVTLDGDRTVNQLRFTYAMSNYGFTIAEGTPAGSLILGGSLPEIDVTNLGSQARITAALGGVAGWTKIGHGTLFLDSAASTYTGSTVIQQGRVVISNSGALGSDPSAVVVSGNAEGSGQLVLAGGRQGMTFTRDLSLAGQGYLGLGSALVSVGPNTLTGEIAFSSTTANRAYASLGLSTIAGNIDLGSPAATNLTFFDGVGSWKIDGDLTSSANATIVKAGAASTLWLTGNSSGYLGAIRVDGGSLRVEGGGNLGAGTAVAALFLNGGSLEVRSDDPTFTTPRNVQILNGLSSNTINIGRGVGGSGLSETVQLGALNIIDARGTTGLIINGRDGYGLTFASQTGITDDTGFTLTSNINGLLTITGNYRSVDSNAASTIVATGDVLITGSILNGSTSTRNGALTKSGTGYLTVQGTGAVNLLSFSINGGTVAIGGIGSVNGGNGASGTLNLGVAGALVYLGTGSDETFLRTIDIKSATANVHIYANQSTGKLTLNPTAFTAAAGAKTLVIGGTNTLDNEIAKPVPANATNLLKTGAGTWVLSAANLYTGTTTVSAGTLKLKDSGAGIDILPTASDVVFNQDPFTHTAGGILEYLGRSGESSTETVGDLVLTAGPGTITVTPGDSGSATLTFSSLGAVSAGSSVNVTGSGSVVLTGVATGLVNPHITIGGADFARSVDGTLVAPVYGTDATFVTSASTLTADSNNEITGTFSTEAIAITTLKVNGAQTLTANGAVTLGGILQAGGAGSIDGSGGITTGSAADMVIRVNEATDSFTLATPILDTTTGGLTKNGAGTLVLAAANAQTGGVVINEGTLRLTAGSTLGANNIALTIRQNATLDLNGVDVVPTNAVNVLAGAGVITNTAASGTATFTAGNGGSSGAFFGTIQDGPTAKVALTKAGGGTLTLTGASTFTGPVRITGTLSVNALADIGTASPIGKGDVTANAASLVFASAASTLQYTGANTVIFQPTQSPSIAIDRLFTLANNGTIESSGTYGNSILATGAANHAALVFTNTGDIAFEGSGDRILTLGGTSTGSNEMKPTLLDNPNGGNLALTKTNAGLWILGNTGNSYSGPTTITQGVLQVGDDSSPSTRTLSPNSALLLGSGSTIGILQSTGTLTRDIAATATAGRVTWNSTTGGGFAASHGKLVVALGGEEAPTALTWGTGGFVANGVLVLNSSTALGEVEIRNPIDLTSTPLSRQLTTTLGSASATIGVTSGVTVGQVITGPNLAPNTTIIAISTNNLTLSAPATGSGTGVASFVYPNRTIQVDDNTTTFTDFASISGTISGTNTGLIKTGAGNLVLTGANTYNGSTWVQAGTLTVTSLGGSGDSSVGSAGGRVLLGSAGVTASLVYAGPGEISSRIMTMQSSTVGVSLDASGSGPLVLTSNLAIPIAGAKTLTLTGGSTDANEFAGVLANPATGNLSVTKTGTGNWYLSGANTYSGNTAVQGGSLMVNSLGGGSTTSSSLGNATGILQLGAAANPGAVIYVGPGETSARTIALQGSTGGGTIDASGFTAFILTSNLSVPTNGVKTLTLSGSSTAANSFEGIIPNSASGTTSLAKTGVGTWVITAANTYTGATTVNRGTLVINGTQTAATGAVTVAAGGTLRGSGATGGAVTALSGAIVAPGGLLDTGSFASTILNLQANSTLSITISGTNFTLNTDEEYDRYITSGNSTLAGNLSVDLSGYTLTGGESFGIMQIGGTRSGVFANYPEGSTVLSNGGFDLRITYLASFVGSDPISLTGGSNVALYATAVVPESRVTLAVAFLLLAAIRFRRRSWSPAGIGTLSTAKGSS